MCSTDTVEVRFKISSKSRGTSGARKASSINSGNRFSTPMRGCISLARLGRFLPIVSMQPKTSLIAPYCLRLLAS